MHNDRKVWVYDIESFGNFFSCIYYNIDTLERKDFIVCKWQDDLADFIEFTTSSEMKGMIGYNNVGFDYPLIHRILTKQYIFKRKNGEQKARIIKGWANKIIEMDFSSISEKHTKIPQLDLFLVNHLNSGARFASLKWCEFALRWDSLQDLPFAHDHEVSKDQIQDIMGYNFNDVLATHRLYQDCTGKIELRKKLSKHYNLKLLNANDPKIGSEIFAKILCERNNWTWSQLRKMRTFREEIDLGECIFDYVKFESPEFNVLSNFLKNKTITSTKGVFDDLTVNYKGLNYVFGTGGLHACCKPGVYEIDDEHEIVDIDVKCGVSTLLIQGNLSRTIR